MRLVPVSLVMAGCVLLAGCSGAAPTAQTVPADNAAPSARFFEHTVYGDPDRFEETVHGAFDWSTRTGWVVVSGPGRLELIQIGDRCYRRWDRGSWRKSIAHDPGGLCNSALLESPATTFELIKSVGENRTRLATTRVNGVETTHYRAGLNIGALKGTIELWVDGDGVVRRTRQQGESAKDFVGVRDYVDFDAVVHVRPPRNRHSSLDELVKND